VSGVAAVGAGVCESACAKSLTPAVLGWVGLAADQEGNSNRIFPISSLF
jgi:hypothetical protein